MFVGFDTEYSFRRGFWTGRNYHGDVSTFYPVCACLVFQDGREIRVTERWDDLRPVFEDPKYSIVVHGCHAEALFCRRVGIPFPARLLDTHLMSVMLLQAKSHDHDGSVYANSALARMAARYGISHPSADDKDAIRESILRGTFRNDFGMDRVLDYCRDDARAGLRLVVPLSEDIQNTCGPHAMKNLMELYTPYAMAMAGAAAKGLRFDQENWGRALDAAPRYRGALLAKMRKAGYDHDGEGLGDRGFRRMITRLGLEPLWPRTPTGVLRTREDDLKSFRHVEAIDASYKLVKFDSFMNQNVGSLVDSDGRLRCSILPLAQRSSRNSTVGPNLMGIPAEMRPLFLPDEGCKFIHFDYSQQEPGVAGYLSGDEGLVADFSNGDVYRNLGMRMGLLTPSMSAAQVRAIRNSVLKALMLSIIYGKSAVGIARDLPCSLHQAKLHLQQFERTYSRLFAWLKNYVSTALERGWAENVIGFRAAFNVRDPRSRSHVARSAQNFPVQSSAAACFQVTGVHLTDFGADVRLPMHDAYLLNVIDDPREFRQTREMIRASTTAANHQLFPGLAVKVDTEILNRFAKDGKEDSFTEWLTSLEDR